MIRFLSICSGIEAASVAWKPLGWKAVGFAEIEPFPSAVLAHHYPEVPNFGDMTKFEEWKIDEPVDLVCGGTPCQAFSVAGKRGGMDDARGQLSLKFVEIVARYRPRWVVWENVPGVFSSGGGADFGSFLGALTGRDVQAPADGWGNSGVLEGIPDAYGVAWRTLDAQYFGVPQRRRRVFVVGHIGDWRRAAAVLFERESLCGHPAPCRQAGEGTARGLEFGPSGGGFTDLNPTLDARAKDGPIRNQLAGAVLDVSAPVVSKWSKGSGGPAGDEVQNLVPVTGSEGGGEFQTLESSAARTGEVLNKLNTNSNASGRNTPMVAFQSSQSGVREVATHATLDSNNGSRRHNGIVQAMQVRRLTPLECERLQGFPDDYTRIPWRKAAAEDCPDGPRYKALGNSWAVPCARWIGERIQMVEEKRP